MGVGVGGLSGGRGRGSVLAAGLVLIAAVGFTQAADRMVLAEHFIATG